MDFFIERSPIFFNPVFWKSFFFPILPRFQGENRFSTINLNQFNKSHYGKI